MADTDVWGLGLLSSLSSGYRIPAATSSGAGGYFPLSRLLFVDDSGKITSPLAAANYSFNFAAVNPARGIIGDIANNGASGLTGVMQSFTQNTIANNCFGMVPGSADMALYFNRNLAADGTLAWRWQSDGHYRPGADNSYDFGTASFRARDTFSTRLRPGAGAVIWTSGAGSPESVVSAPVGSLYTRTDGGAGTTLYVKETGSGNTGWVGK